MKYCMIGLLLIVATACECRARPDVWVHQVNGFMSSEIVQIKKDGYTCFVATNGNGAAGISCLKD